jgi:hypothetical protein
MRDDHGWPTATRDSPDPLSRAVVGFIILGIVLRLVRYLQNYPMWCDETMLAVNLLERNGTELVQPLAYRQVCPVGFLAVEWAAVRLLGFAEFSLRLMPVLCAVATMPLFGFLARRVLGGGSRAHLLAVALFAVSEPPIRYAAEVKPYSADLLASLVLLSLAVAWLQNPLRCRPLWVLAAVVPLVAATSLPSVFLIAAIVAVGSFEVLARRQTKLTIAFGQFLAATGLTVGLLWSLGQYHASPEDSDYLSTYWKGAFPPAWRDPAGLAAWLVRTHTGPFFAYPHGANRLAWLTALIFGCFLVGIVLRARQGATIVSLLVLPFLLALAAAAMRRYPYGISARVGQFLVPSILLLAATGLAWLCARARPRPLARWITPALAVILVGLGAWRLARDLGSPHRTPWDRTAREFARWFWTELSADAELICVRTDLGIPFGPEPWAYDGADHYLCLQRIYSPRHQQRRSPRWHAISGTRPLRCVLLNRMPAEVPAFLDWIETHRDRYTLRDVRTYPATRGSPVEPAQTYVVCEFVPTSQASAPTPTGRELRTVDGGTALGDSATKRQRSIGVHGTNVR